MEDTNRKILKASLLLEDMLLLNKSFNIPNKKIDRKENFNEKKSESIDYKVLYNEEVLKNNVLKSKIKDLSKKKDLLYSENERLKKLEKTLNIKIENLANRVKSLDKISKNLIDEENLVSTQLNKYIAFKLLGLSESTSIDCIKKHYISLMKIFHIDKNKYVLEYKAKNISMAFQFIENLLEGDK